MKQINIIKTLSLCLLLILTASCKDRISADKVKDLTARVTEAAKKSESETSRTATKALSYEEIMMPAKLTDRSEQILKRTGYTVSYNKDMRLPNWVAWHLTAARTKGDNKRDGIKFQEDTDVPSPRATHADYVRSGYDRGHMCPAGDNKWSAAAMEESFLMTNICPQHPNLNRGDWSEMENACRDWAEEYGDLVIVAGPIFYKGSHKKIGKNKVVVPEAFFKVILTLEGDEPQAVGFIYKNNKGNLPKDSYINSIDNVERITGIDFFPALPDEIEDKVETYTHLL